MKDHLFQLVQAADVRPFLEREEDAALLNMETALQLLVS